MRSGCHDRQIADGLIQTESECPNGVLLSQVAVSHTLSETLQKPLISRNDGNLANLRGLHRPPCPMVTVGGARELDFSAMPISPASQSRYQSDAMISSATLAEGRRNKVLGVPALTPSTP